MAKRSFDVLIVGYGEMGHAFDHLLGDGHRIHVWDCRPEDISEPESLSEFVTSSRFIFFCVPTNALESLAQRILPWVDTDSICLSIAKGLDQQGRTANEILLKVYGDRCDHGVIYGPMISEEIRINKPAFAQLGCPDHNTYHVLADLFCGRGLYLEHSTDAIGISWSAILKNVYAILFGVCDGLELGDNMRGYLSVASLTELASIITELGGDASTPYHLAGLGDLITTATSKGSHHHELGCMLAREQEVAMTGEAVNTLSMIRKHSLFDVVKFPLISLVGSIIKDPTAVAEKLENHLMEVFPMTRLSEEIRLKVNPEIVCFIIEKAHEFQAQEHVVLPDDNANLDEEKALGMLADYAGDPSYTELESAISNLSFEEQVNLVALMWLGRGVYDKDEWPTALQQAADSWNGRTAGYLIGTPLVADYLAEGLSLLGYACNE